MFSVTRPTPLSTMVNKLNRKVLTRSALLKTVLNKVYELKMEPPQDAEENVEYVIFIMVTRLNIQDAISAVVSRKLFFIYLNV